MTRHRPLERVRSRGTGRDPIGVASQAGGQLGPLPDADAPGDRAGDRVDVAGRDGQPMIGRGAGDRRRALDGAYSRFIAAWSCAPLSARPVMNSRTWGSTSRRAANARASLIRPGPHAKKSASSATRTSALSR